MVPERRELSREAPESVCYAGRFVAPKWLYELNSLDPENLRKNFKNSEDITYDEIACFKAASLLDAFAGGRADYVMVDVEV